MLTMEQLRAKWDKYAARYDRDIGFFERVQFAGGREWVCSQAQGDVLEVAVGTGRNLPFYPDSVRLTGIDFSSAMLDVARGRAGELGKAVDLREGTRRRCRSTTVRSTRWCARSDCVGFPMIARRSPRCTGCCVRAGRCCCSITLAATTS